MGFEFSGFRMSKKIILCIKHQMKRMKKDPNFGEKVTVERIVLSKDGCVDCK